MNNINNEDEITHAFVNKLFSMATDRFVATLAVAAIVIGDREQEKSLSTLEYLAESAESVITHLEDFCGHKDDALNVLENPDQDEICLDELFERALDIIWPKL